MNIPCESLPPLEFELSGANSIAHQVDFIGLFPDVDLFIEPWVKYTQFEIIDAISGVIFEVDEPNLETNDIKDTFAQSPGLIIAAFKESKQHEQMSKETINRLGNYSVMYEELGDRSSIETIANRMVSIADYGLANHPEAKTLVQSTKLFYEEVFKSMEVGHSAYRGMGYTLGLLDIKWAEIRQELVEKAVKTETETVDWEYFEKFLFKGEKPDNS